MDVAIVGVVIVAVLAAAGTPVRPRAQKPRSQASTRELADMLAASLPDRDVDVPAPGHETSDPHR